MSGVKNSSKVRNSLEILVLSSAVLLLWAIQTLPVIFYNMQTEYSRNSSRVQVKSTAMECSSPYVYHHNGVCFSQLKDVLDSYNCQLTQENATLIARNSEPMAKFLLNSLNMLTPSDDCRASILPFYCLYLFGLCDDAGEMIQPTRDQCEEIQFTTCSREWSLAEQFGFSLPVCGSLPSGQNISCPSKSTIESGSSKMQSPSSSNDSILQCQKHFMYDKSLQGCVANCNTWNWNDDTTSKLLQVVLLCTYSIGIVLSFIILVISGIRYKSMLRIPSIFLIYTTLDIIVLDFFGILSAGHRGLYCSSPSLLNTTVTPFCSIYGTVFAYFIVQLQFWWLFHISVIMWGICMPLNYQKMKDGKVMKYTHIILVVLGIILPSFPIIATTSRFATLPTEVQNTAIISGGIGYISFTWPSIFCTSFNTSTIMYTFILPIELLLAIGGPLLFITFYILYKNRKQFGSAEKKLVMMFSYYLLITLLVIGSFTWMVTTNSAAQDAVIDYFFCESQSYNQKMPCSKDHRNYNYDIVAVVTLAVFALYPIYVLIVVVSAKDVKEIIRVYNFFHLSELSSK